MSCNWPVGGHLKINATFSEAALQEHHALSDTNRPIDIPNRKYEVLGFTSIHTMVLRRICILIDDAHNSLVQSILTESTLISLLSNVSCRSSKHLIKDVSAKSVWLVVTPHTKNNSSFIKFAEAIMTHKLSECGHMPSEPRVLAMYILLLDSATRNDIPKELRKLYHLNINVGSGQIVEFIEGRHNRMLRDVDIKLAENVPVVKLFIELLLQLDGQQHYIQSAYDILKELFNDGASYPRQHLLQLYKLPNVHVLEEDSSLEDRKVCIEIRPNCVKAFVHFAKACEDGKLADMLRTHLKVNREPFIGGVVIQPFTASEIQNLISQLQPGLFSENLTTHAIEETVLRSDISDNDIKVPSLKALVAGNIYEIFLRKTGRTPYEFLWFTRQTGCSNLLLDIRSKCGYNALHMAVKEERFDYLTMLLYSGKWGDLRCGIVPEFAYGEGSLHTHRGYTPKRLADALSYKCDGYNIQRYFDKLDTLYLVLPPLFRCCMMGHLEYVQVLVEHHPESLGLKDNLHNNCLMYACASGMEKVVEYLLMKGVPGKVLNDDNRSAVHFAAMFGHTHIVKLLAEKDIVRGIRDKTGYSAIDLCAMNGDKTMLQLYKEIQIPIDAQVLTSVVKNSKGDTNYEMVKYLLETIKVDVNSGEDSEGRLAIHYAIKGESEKILQLLLRHGADIHKLDRYNKNVFHLAPSYLKGIKMVTMLKEACIRPFEMADILTIQDYFVGKDVTFVVRGKDRGRKAWHWVELKRLSVNAFRSTLASGQIDVARFGKILVSGFGQGPDEMAESRMKARTEECLTLEEGGCRPDMTPLHIAVLKEKVDIVHIYLQSGADPNAKDSFGATPMHYAAMNGNVAILNMLEEAKANVNTKTDDGLTPEKVADENNNDKALHFFKAKVVMENTQRFVDKPLEMATTDLSMDKLTQVRGNQCVRKHIVDVLRNLSIDINLFLMELGSGPVLEESDSRPHTHSQPTT